MTIRLCMAVALVFTLAIGATAETKLDLDPRVERLDFRAPGRATLLNDGRFASVNKGTFFVSADGGVTWDTVALVDGGDGPKVDSGMLIEDNDGNLVVIYRDDAGYHLERTPDNMPLPGGRLQIWSARSTDGGKTWTDHQILIPGYCGAMIDGICTRENRIVIPLQDLRYDPPHHVTVVLSSGDGGMTWHTSADLDIGGYGIEDGAFESTVAQREDGSLLMHLRTARDRLWRSTSADLGRTWSLPVPTDIPSSNSPSFLLALESGRFAMVWNPVHPDGQEDWPRRVKTRYAERPDSVYREELRFALSDDEGVTWTEPVIIAQEDGAKLRYAYMIERSPGVIWLALRGAWFKIVEDDFLPKP